jgi:hypothetical protein
MGFLSAGQQASLKAPAKIWLDYSLTTFVGEIA